MTIKEKIIQKLSGIIFIAISVIVTCFDNDATIAMIFVPLGIWMLFSKKRILY